jgi:hypothetical protein
VLTRQEWFWLLKKAHDFDLDAGGYADPRSGCINFWVGPDNKPPGYDHPITAGTLDYPREYLGEVFPQWDEQAEHIIGWEISTTDYEGREKARGHYTVFQNLPEHVKWVKREFSQLHQIILGRPVDVPFMVKSAD